MRAFWNQMGARGSPPNAPRTRQAYVRVPGSGMTALGVLARPLLTGAERALVASVRPRSTPPVFILGLPRSGTTLLYQVLVHCFEFAYFCNAAAARSLYPAVTTRLLRRWIRRYDSDFVSSQGKTDGFASPSEAPDIWHRWFSADRHYADETSVSAAGAEEMRRTVAAVAGILGAPFLSKDPHHSVRVRALNKVFPGCLFVCTDRDPAICAGSMLRVRIARAGSRGRDLSTWTSVKPKEYELLVGRPPIEQVCGQAYYCGRNTLEDLTAVAPGRFLTVGYDGLCREPRAEVDRIAVFLADRGVSPRRTRSCPEAFPEPAGRGLPESDQAAIRACLDRLQRAAGH